LTGGQHFQGQLLKELYASRTVDGGFDAEEPCQHAIDVSVDYGPMLIGGERGDRRSGIHPDSGESEERIEVGRENALKISHYHFCRLQHIACPGIVAQALPVPEYLFFRRPCKVANRWVGIQKAMEIGQALLNTRLLQNNFREPDDVRIAAVPPGQVALMPGIPANQLIREIHPANILK